MREFIFIVGGGLSACFLLTLAIAYAIGPAHCNARWPDRPHEWGLLSGCMVEHNGQMIPEDRIWFERQ